MSQSQTDTSKEPGISFKDTLRILFISLLKKMHSCTLKNMSVKSDGNSTKRLIGEPKVITKETKINTLRRSDF